MTEEHFSKVLEKEYNGSSPRELSPLVLAYIGDAVYEILARTRVVSLGNSPVNKMNAKAKKIVNAKSQCDAYFKIADMLTEDEAAVFRRGRNANSYIQKIWILTITATPPDLRRFSDIYICQVKTKE